MNSDSTSATTIEERLSKLERTARRWRLAALGLAGVVVLCVGMGADDPFPKVIKANSFEIVDENGKQIGGMGIAKAGDVPSFVLSNQKEKRFVLLTPASVTIIRDGAAVNRLE